MFFPKSRKSQFANRSEEPPFTSILFVANFCEIFKYFGEFQTLPTFEPLENVRFM